MPKLNISRLTKSSTRPEKLEIQTSNIIAKPTVKSPDWEIRYDQTLNVYYFVNIKTNQTQFDHPDEVISPIVDNNDVTEDYRKFVFGPSLKRTLSPRFFKGRNSYDENANGDGNDDKKNSNSNNVNINNDNNGNGDTNFNDNFDEDVEEFKKQFSLEMKSYETERLRNI